MNDNPPVPFPASFWDERYSATGLVYGSLPNAYLARVLGSSPPGMLLLPGEGEGRNALWAARQGWQVEAFDQSNVGMAKAAAQAVDAGLEIDFRVQDIATYTPERLPHTHIALLFLHLPAWLRTPFHRRLVEAMAPGATILLESFSPSQIELARTSGGPKDPALCLTLADLEIEFAGLETLELLAGTVLLDEGPYHQGPAEVVRLLARKPN